MSIDGWFCNRLGARLRGHDGVGQIGKFESASQNRFVQVIPVWIHFFDQPQLPCSVPFLEPLLANDRQLRHSRAGGNPVSIDG